MKKTNVSNKILCLLISVFMLISMVQVSVFATDSTTPATRTFYVEVEDTEDKEVYAGEEVVITVRVDGENIYGAQWTLGYDDTKFQFVTEGSDPLSYFKIQQNNTPIPADTVLGTYKFIALAHSTVVKGDFTVEDAVAQTRVEAADNIVATPEIEIEEVTILLKDGLSTQLSYNDKLLEGNTAIPYSDDGYNISWKAFIDDVEDDTADIKIWLNGVEQTGDGFFLKEVGSYEIKWSTTKDGYIASEGTYVLNINEATFKYDVEFDGNVVEGNSKEIVFDGAEHTVTITSEPTVDIAVTVGGVATSIDDLKFTSVGKYVIGYTIAKHGYTTVYGEFTVNITNAEFDLVEVKVDGDAVADGDVLEYDFDGTEHTITVDTKPADADVNVVVKVDGVDTPIEDLKYAAVGEHLIEYEVSKPGYTTVRGSFTLKINVPDYVVEVNFGENTDYVNDKKLVLVYTNSDAISFKYGPQALTMYDVTSKGYIYDGEEYFAQTADTNVFAVVVDYIENSSLADYEAEVAVEYSVLSNDYVIEAPVEGLECDLNDSDAIELGDVIASFATYHGDEDYYPELMGVVLRADVTNDKKVNGDDNRACATAFEKAFYGN